MPDSTTTTCARHPDVETRLRCSQCGTPICPRCSVETPVGQKCPDCAKQKRSARRQGRPRQYAKGVGAGLAAAFVAALVMAVASGIPIVRFFAAYFGGLGIASAVIWGAEGNRNPAFRNWAVGLSLVAVGGWLFWATGTPLPSPISLLSYLVAGYGAYQRFNRF